MDRIYSSPHLTSSHELYRSKNRRAMVQVLDGARDRIWHYQLVVDQFPDSAPLMFVVYH